MNIGDILFVSYKDHYQLLYVISHIENVFNENQYTVYCLSGNHILYVKNGVQISSPLDIQGHVIVDAEKEIQNDDYYFKVNPKFALPMGR